MFHKNQLMNYLRMKFMVNLRGAHGMAFKGKKTCQKSL